MHKSNQILLWDQATVKLLDVRRIERVQGKFFISIRFLPIYFYFRHKGALMFS